MLFKCTQRTQILKFSFLLFLDITVDINWKLVLLRKNVILYRQMAVAVVFLFLDSHVLWNLCFQLFAHLTFLAFGGCASRMHWYFFMHLLLHRCFLSSSARPGWLLGPVTTDPSRTAVSCLNTSFVQNKTGSL